VLIQVTDPSLVVLIGPSGAGKSTFARRHFRSTEILSSDSCRALVCDDESNQTATNDAFDLLHLILDKRLAWRRTTLVDATNVQLSARAPLVAAAKQRRISLVAIVFALPEEICQRRNQQRSSRQVSSEVIRNQIATLATTIKHLEAEHFDSIYRLQNDEEVNSVTIVRIV
jgi:protein phosphatase